MTTPDKAAVDQLTAILIDRGKLIEAGWIGLRMMALPADAPAIQLQQMRNAFFAGAHHLFSSILHVFDPGEEPTEQDLRRMALINDELNQFLDDARAKGWLK